MYDPTLPPDEKTVEFLRMLNERDLSLDLGVLIDPTGQTPENSRTDVADFPTDYAGLGKCFDHARKYLAGAARICGVSRFYSVKVELAPPPSDCARVYDASLRFVMTTPKP